MEQPQRACVNCHFFTKVYLPRNHGEIAVVWEDVRAKLRKGEMEDDRKHYVLSCFRGVWDEGNSFSTDRWFQELVERNRGEECYFRPHVRGMALPAAEALEEREYNARETGKGLDLTRQSIDVAAKGLDLTRKSIKVAIWGLYASVVLGLINLVMGLCK